MTKKDIADKLCNVFGLSKSAALHAVDGVSTILADAFTKGENVYLRGLGTFEVKATKEKKGYDISRRRSVVVPASRTVKFRISNELKNRINNVTVD